MNIAEDVNKRLALRERKIEQAAENFNESTGLSWLWAFLLGPIYFGANFGVWWFLGTLAAGIATFGLAVFAWPFLAYPAHRQLARKKAEKFVELEMLRTP